MSYLPSAILLTVGLIALTAVGEKKSMQNPKRLKLLAVVNTAVSAAGFLIALVTHLIAKSGMTDSSLDSEFSAWASDMHGIWYQISLPTFALLFGITFLAVLTALADKKQQSGIAPVMRVSAVSAASVVFLILAPFYGFMTENTTLPLYQYILWSGIGMSLAMRFVCAAEYICRMRLTVKKK